MLINQMGHGFGQLYQFQLLSANNATAAPPHTTKTKKGSKRDDDVDGDNNKSSYVGSNQNQRRS